MTHLPPPTDEATALAHILSLTPPGNGDDVALLAVPSGLACVSTDSTLEGVHSPLGTTATALGRRAAARALSDLAAAAALPAGAVCAVHIPPNRWADAVELVTGVVARLAEQGCALVGGDLTSTTDGAPLGTTITVFGRRASSRSSFTSRAHARAGDAVLVTGSLGAAGLALERGDRVLPEPPDRLRAGRALAPFVHAMMDVSDGIARDAGLLALRSGVGIAIDLETIPCAPGCDDPLAAARFGDDYELLVAMPPDRIDAARRALGDLPLTRIGNARHDVSGVVFLRDGRQIDARVCGHVHL